jgi:hypothetical protein
MKKVKIYLAVDSRGRLMFKIARFVRGSLIARLEGSKDLKVEVGEDRSLRGSQTRNPVPSLTPIWGIDTGWGVPIKKNL